MNELHELDAAIAAWRSAEDAVAIAEDEAKKAKEVVELKMHELGLKAHENPFGKIAIYPIKSLTWLVTDKQRDAMLRQHGMYDHFCTSKLDMTKIKKYVEDEDDSLFGMVEPKTTYAMRFTKFDEEGR